MPKLFLFAAAAALAVPAVAQTGGTATPPPGPNMAPPPEFIAAAQAFGQCIATKAQAAPATATAEAAAHQTVLGCATERSALDTRFQAWVASPSFPADKREQALAQYRAQMGQVETQVADQFREMRAQGAAPAPGATPTPAPSATPAPR